MYIGRFLVAAPGIAGYRVSSRSFPNRQTRETEDGVIVEPTPDAPAVDNPYVSYTCIRTVSEQGGRSHAVVGNGSHVDPIAEKLTMGYPPRDALASALLTLDFEKDDYDTPRIGAVIDPTAATVGIVRRDALLVEAVENPTLVATYEKVDPEPVGFEADGARAAATSVFEMDFEHPVCAAGVAWDGDDWTVSTVNDG